MSKLNIDQQTIKELFANKKSDFLIPDYQRPYAWNDVECQTLWDDIFSFAFPDNDYTLFDSENDEYFLGSIVTFKNEDKKLELCFDDEDIVDKFVELTSRLSILYRDDKTRFSMGLLSDILKWLVKNKLITIDDLYELSDDEVVEIINKSRLKDVFDKWANMNDVKVSKNMPGDYYWVRSRAKIRYIDPLVNDSRISSLSENARKNIANNFNYDMENYVYSDSIKLKKLEK